MCQGSVTAANLPFMNGSVGWEMNHQWVTSSDITHNEITLAVNNPQTAALHGKWKLLQVLRMNPNSVIALRGPDTISVTKAPFACLGACAEPAQAVTVCAAGSWVPCCHALCRLFAEHLTIRKPKGVRRSWAGASRKPGCSSLPVCIPAVH